MQKILTSVVLAAGRTFIKKVFYKFGAKNRVRSRRDRERERATRVRDGWHGDP